MTITEAEGMSRILTEAQVREAWALTGGPSIADWPHLTDTKKWHWRVFTDHILRRYGGVSDEEARRREREAVARYAERHTCATLNGLYVDMKMLRAWLDKRYPEIPTPAPAKEPEARTNLLSRAELSASLIALAARVRALEGK